MLPTKFELIIIGMEMITFSYEIFVSDTAGPMVKS